MIPFLADIDPLFKVLAPRSADWLTILPEIAVAGLSLLCLLQAMFLPKALRLLIPVTARTGLILVAIMALTSGPWMQSADLTSFAGLLRQNLPTDGVRLVFLLSALLTSFLAEGFLRDRDAAIADYHHVLLVVTAAFMLLAQANHFVTFFLSLETAAVGLYVLVGYLRRSEASLEAGVKFLVTGSLSSALLLMGIVLVYGALGSAGVADSLNFTQIGKALAAQSAAGTVSPLTLTGIALILGGVAFKLGAFPFHTWIPDVYQGAPTPTTAFLGTASKAAGAFTLLLLATGPFAPLATKIAPLLAGGAVLTLLAGNLGALATTDVKRTLALSGVAHAGFILAAVTAALVVPGVEAFGYDVEQVVVLYLLAYVVGTFLTAQALVALPALEDHRRPQLALRGLLRRSPLLGGALGFGIGSLAGIPPSVGFIAKLLVLVLLVSAKLWWVLGAALLGVAIGIHYYFSILREAVVRPTEDGEEIVALELPFGTRALVFVLAAASILGGLFVLAGR
ncbi:MAG: NADH-quinone oxidoreductase subunit N [Opitutia bacterium]|nr:NADH-quinone oxidoreductase subunit N [Opitutales bacterium]PHX79893.1 MAG: NADH-quinone oxidoreductase subunit N [Opitutae bacterium]